MSIDQDAPRLDVPDIAASADKGVERIAAPNVGDRLRARRKLRGLSVRELARRLGVSASLISQIETGKATPSVATLYAVTTELGLSLDELFSEPGVNDAPAATAPLRPTGLGPTAIMPGAATSPVVTPEHRKLIQLDSGVSWERLTHTADPNVEFLRVVYQPGSASCEADSLMRHNGHEYGFVLSGTLLVTLGFDDHVLHAGSSISFDSTRPHRLATIGDEPVEAIWFVVGRSGDSRHR